VHPSGLPLGGSFPPPSSPSSPPSPNPSESSRRGIPATTIEKWVVCPPTRAVYADWTKGSWFQFIPLSALRKMRTRAAFSPARTGS
jgi:hypothetical protein